MSERPSATDRLTDVELDASIGRSTPDVEHERAVAIFDLVEENSFRPVADEGQGPYKLKLSLADSKLVFAVSREDGEPVVTHILSLTPFRRIMAVNERALAHPAFAAAHPDRQPDAQTTA